MADSWFRSTFGEDGGTTALNNIQWVTETKFDFAARPRTVDGRQSAIGWLNSISNSVCQWQTEFDFESVRSLGIALGAKQRNWSCAQAEHSVLQV